MTVLAAPTTAPPPSLVRHSAVEDALGLLTGTFLVSLGLYLLHSTQAVTGGTAGLSLVLGYAGGWPFGVVFLLVNLPFMALALRHKGWVFSLRTLACILAVSGFSFLHPWALGSLHAPPLYAVVGGNLLCGVGILVLFRHRASVGGLNIVALLAQERLGWRAGYVQLAADLVIILSALAVTTPLVVAVSAVGAVVLNVVLALNHRPGRYLGG